MSKLYEEPYRYVCIACGSTQVTRRREKEGAYRLDELHHFYCMVCRSKSKWAYDKKRGFDVDVHFVAKKEHEKGTDLESTKAEHFM